MYFTKMPRLNIGYPKLLHSLKRLKYFDGNAQMMRERKLDEAEFPNRPSGMQSVADSDSVRVDGFRSGLPVDSLDYSGKLRVVQRGKSPS